MTRSSEAKEIPGEIWLKILRFATETPLAGSLVQPEYISNTSQGIWLSTAAYRRYEELFVTKRSVVLVCHQWNAFATAFLYEHLYLKNIWILNMALNTVSGKLKTYNSDENRSFGKLIKRMDFQISSWDMSGKMTCREYPPIYESVSKLCRLAPNLVALVANIMCETQTFPLSDIISGPRLEYIYLGDNLNHTISDWTNFMDDHPCLTSIVPPFLSPSSPSDTWKGKTWSAIRRLSCRLGMLEAFASEFTPVAFANLQELMVPYSPKRAHLSTVLSNQGRTLTSIYLEYSYVEDYTRSVRCGDRLFDLLSDVHEHCPYVKEVKLTLTGVDVVFHGDSSANFANATRMPQITAFGVQFQSPMVYEELGLEVHWGFFLEFVVSPATIFPNLGTIKMLDERDLYILRVDFPELFSVFLGVCENRRLREVDAFGGLVQGD